MYPSVFFLNIFFIEKTNILFCKPHIFYLIFVTLIFHFLNHYNIRSLFTLLCLLFLLQLKAQGWDRTLTDSLTITAVTPTQDNGCIVAGYFLPTGPFPQIIKVDANGKKEWKRDLRDSFGFSPLPFPLTREKLIEDSEGNFWFSKARNDANTSQIIKLDKSGNVLLRRSMGITNLDIQKIENQIILLGPTSSGQPMILTKLKNNGDTISTQSLNFLKPVKSPYFVSEVQGNELLVFGLTDSVANVSISGFQTTRFNLNGVLIAKNHFITPNFFSPYPFFDIIKTSDGGFLIPDSSNINKISKDGKFVWRKNLNLGILNVQNPFPIPYLKHLIAPQNSNGEFIGIKPVFSTNPSQIAGQFNVNKYSSEGVLLKSSTVNFTGNLINPFLIKSPKGGYILLAQGANNKIRLIKFNEDGYVYPNFIKGNIYSDKDANCKLSNNDIPIQRVMVIAQKAGQPDFVATTDTLGKYTLNLEAGTYNINVVNPNPYMQACTPSVSKTVSITSPLDSTDFALQSNFDCALMQVDVSTPRLRRCFNNTYNVSYCNKGTATANNAYVNITLDSLLEFVTSDKIVTSKNGRTYRFNLGNVSINECKSFDIVARVRCGDSTRLNQTICVEAKIYPDTVCAIDNSLWSGASLIVNGTCQGDSVTFLVRNNGTSVAAANQASVVENLSTRSVNIPALSPNAVFTQRFPSKGSTWRMILNQVANHPRSIQPTAFVEGCRTNSSSNFTTGLAAGFANDDAHASIDVDCQPIIGAYDPNDKTGYPLGTGVTKAITQNQDLEYMIRFQNTGTDTAFTVVIRDTLDITKLEIKSIEWGSSSHKYMPEIYGENIIKFTFDNILLVDSFTNEPASNGYVKFRIKQKKDLAFGTRIQNSAGIYFDFNDPVLTNKTLHTVSKTVVSSIFENEITDYETINIYPNPVSESAVIELTNTPLSISTLELFDIVGQRVMTQTFSGKTCVFQRKGFVSGVYLAKVMNGNKIMSVAKIVIQ
jgi:hypothetical protein